jgi:hypothetical protein
MVVNDADNENEMDLSESRSSRVRRSRLEKEK